jgi:hypothetical protein
MCHYNFVRISLDFFVRIFIFFNLLAEHLVTRFTFFWTWLKLIFYFLIIKKLFLKKHKIFTKKDKSTSRKELSYFIIF